MLENESQTTTSTSRLTENKRRYRARRKEYVSDLEQRLAEAREHGVQATKEVQLAAQQVMRENARLRELLGLAGFTHEDIGAWVKPRSCGNKGDGDNCAQRRACEQKARDYAASRREQEGAPEDSKAALQAAAAQLPDAPAPMHSTDALIHVEDAGSETLPQPSQNLTMASWTPANSQDPPSRLEKPCVSAASSSQNLLLEPRGTPPCKLLSRLEDDPSEGLTQTPVMPAAEGFSRLGDEEIEGVECGRAYEMLVRFAISEEKTDTIALALEKGCTPDGRGGCTVRQDVVWQVLDRMCG